MVWMVQVWMPMVWMPMVWIPLVWPPRVWTPLVWKRGRGSRRLGADGARARGGDDQVGRHLPGDRRGVDDEVIVPRRRRVAAVEMSDVRRPGRVVRAQRVPHRRPVLAGAADDR